MWTAVVEWLVRNAEWVFSGIGVVLLIGAVQWLAKWLANRKRGRAWPLTAVRERGVEVAEGSSNEGFVKSGLTPAHIMSEFEATPLLQRQLIASHYRGLTLRVSGKLYNSWGSDQQTTLQLSELPTVFLDVIAAEWPGLSVLRKGAWISAVGEVTDVSEFGVTLSPTKMDY